MMVAQAAGVDYERMIAGEYKLLIEPIAYFTHNGQYYCMTATEAGLYDQMSGGNLRRTMTSLTHKTLPLSMFLEFTDVTLVFPPGPATPPGRRTIPTSSIHWVSASSGLTRPRPRARSRPLMWSTG